jgi:hypothetical protein
MRDQIVSIAIMLSMLAGILVVMLWGSNGAVMAGVMVCVVCIGIFVFLEYGTRGKK